MSNQLKMEQIRPEHRQEVLPMVALFYTSDAVDHPVDRSILEQAFTDVAQAENPLVDGYLIQVEGQVAGYLYLTFLYSCEVAGLCVLIEELYIKPEFQGKGLGKQAMTWVKDRYPQAKRFRLEVTDTNKGAKALYQKMGYDYLEYQQMILDI